MLLVLKKLVLRKEAHMSTSIGVSIGVGIIVSSLLMRNAVEFLAGLAVISFWVGFGLGRG